MLSQMFTKCVILKCELIICELHGTFFISIIVGLKFELAIRDEANISRHDLLIMGCGFHLVPMFCGMFTKCVIM
jgi:hypothetical protein